MSTLDRELPAPGVFAFKFPTKDTLRFTGMGPGVTEGNVRQHLGVIEQRTNEILQPYAALQEGTEDDDKAQEGAIDSVPVSVP